MQSILNAPEVALFGSHKLLTDLFTQHREIRVSKTITLRAKHSWSPGEADDDDIRIAYAYAICRIFGREAALLDCQNRLAVEATAQQVLIQAHRDGAHDKIIRLLAELFVGKHPGSTSFVALSDSIGRLPSENNKSKEEVKRKAYALDQALKPVVFTPFKSFGSNWPTLPFDLIFLGDNFSADRVRTIDKLELDPALTPFPQHVILDFIWNFCSLTNKEMKSNYWEDISYTSDREITEIQLIYSGLGGLMSP